VTSSHGFVGTALQVVMLLLLLSILAAVVASVPGQVAGGVGSQFGAASAQAGRAVSDAQQALQNATDPTHPPSGLAYDNEYAALDVWHVGNRVPGGSRYALSVASIKRRDGATSPDSALYAVIHAELREPRETRILGQLVRSNSDPHDHAVYKGEVFQIGRVLYRLNWVSEEDEAVAAGVLRHPDAVTSALKFEYE
jgi:hypothetical protein